MADLRALTVHDPKTQMLADDAFQHFRSKIKDPFADPEIRILLKLYGVTPVAKLCIKGKKGQPNKVYLKTDIEKAVDLLIEARKSMIPGRPAGTVKKK